MPSVSDAVRLIRQHELSPSELLDMTIAAIERSNHQLNAFNFLDLEGARALARRMDDEVARAGSDSLPALSGVPFGVKDLDDAAGMPTTKGSRWFAGGPNATSDAIHVARLRAAGAIPVGKTATPEFGAWAYTASPLLGVTRNPWNTDRTPGGSSGGSSAAVASGMVPFATASDGGGSIRTPASFCGLVGLRASYGRIATLGDTHLAQNAVVGALVTTVGDAALLLDVMAGPDPRDRTSLPAPSLSYVDALRTTSLRGLRVGYSKDLGFAIVDSEVALVCERAADAVIDAIGATRVEGPIVFEDYTLTYANVEGVDKFVNIDPLLYEERLDELDPHVAPSWTNMKTRSAPEAARVEERRRRLVIQVAELFETIDVLILPVASIPAFAATGPMPNEINGQAVHRGMAVVLTFLASLVNLPAISVPAGTSSLGLPIGIQIIAPRHRDDLVLAIAQRYEDAHSWPRLSPMARP